MVNNWQIYQFSELCDITRGASPRPIHEWVYSQGIPWVKISDATESGSRFIERTNEFIKQEAKNKSVSVHPGDLILSNSATPGIPKFLAIDACIHDGWLLLRNFRNLDKMFCYYLLLNDREVLIEQGNGSIFTNLKTEILKNHKAKIPPLPEQHAIAEILGSLDDKIELNRRMNRTLEEIARALFKSWFVDFDPVRARAEGRDTGLPADLGSLFPDSFEDSPLGEIPKGWKISALIEDFNLTMGQSPPGNTYNQNKMGLPFFQGRTDFGFRYPTNRVYCSEPTRFAETGDTLVSVRAPVGDINMAAEPCALGRGVAAVRHKYGYRSFTYYTIRSIQNKFKQFEAEGTVFGSINKDDFQSLEVLTPIKDIADVFDNQIYPIDQLIENNEKEIVALSELRDALLPRLLSGEVQFKDFQSTGD